MKLPNNQSSITQNFRIIGLKLDTAYVLIAHMLSFFLILHRKLCFCDDFYMHYVTLGMVLRWESKVVHTYFLQNFGHHLKQFSTPLLNCSIRNLEVRYKTGLVILNTWKVHKQDNSNICIATKYHVQSSLWIERHVLHLDVKKTRFTTEYSLNSPERCFNSPMR